MSRVVNSPTTPRDGGVGFRRTRPDDLRHNLRISVWVRWFVTIAWLAQLNYRPNFADTNYIPNTLFAILLLALNGYVHYRIESKREVTWRWALALSTMDTVMLTAGLAISGGFGNTFFVLYYPGLAMFAVVFTSIRLSFAWVTMVAAMYAAVSLAAGPGLDFGIKRGEGPVHQDRGHCMRSSPRSTWFPGSSGSGEERQVERGDRSFSGSGIEALPDNP